MIVRGLHFLGLRTIIKLNEEIRMQFLTESKYLLYYKVQQYTFTRGFQIDGTYPEPFPKLPQFLQIWLDNW